MSDCIFCHPDPQLVIAATDLALVMHFPHAVKRGHIVIAVKTHERHLDLVPPRELSEVGRLMSSAAAALRPLVDAERFYVVSIGDRDLHFHFHLIPKLQNDPVLGPFLFGPDGWRRSFSDANQSMVDQGLTARLRSALA